MGWRMAYTAITLWALHYFQLEHLFAIFQNLIDLDR